MTILPKLSRICCSSYHSKATIVCRKIGTDIVRHGMSSYSNKCHLSFIFAQYNNTVGFYKGTTIVYFHSSSIHCDEILKKNQPSTSADYKLLQQELVSALREKEDYEKKVFNLKQKLASAKLVSSADDDTDNLHAGERLVKVAKASKKAPRPKPVYEDPLIDRGDAMRQYLLEERDLEGIPFTTRRSAYHGEPIVRQFLQTDVLEKAVQKYGSEEALEKVRRSLHLRSKGQHKFTSAERSSDQKTGLGGGSGKVVLFALGMNLVDAFSKGVGWWLTGSKSLFAEMIHSIFDAGNQVSLAVGIHLSSRKPDEKHPYGYTGMRYMTSGVSGLIMLAVGGGMNIYQGVHALWVQAPLEPLLFAFFALGASFVLQAMSLGRALYEINQKAIHANTNIVDYIRTLPSVDPSLAVVLMEDTASITGVTCAGVMVVISELLHSPIYDAFGSIMIGGILFGVANYIVRRNAQFLIGRSMPKEEKTAIISHLETDPMVSSVHDVKATVLGPAKYRFKAEIDFNGRNVTNSYLEKQDLAQLLEEVKLFGTTDELKSFMLQHGAGIIDTQGAEVDRIEKEIKERQPKIRHVDLEAL